MNTSPAPHANAPDAPHPASEFAAALDTILASTLLMIAAQFRLLGAFTLPIWTRFSRARVRLARLLAKLAAGTWRPSPPRAPDPDRKHGAPAPYSPHGHLWLIRKAGYHAAAFGSQLTFLLQNPNTQALLATAPPQALAAIGRTLRPLCHLLGVDLPKPLLLSPRGRGEPEGGSSQAQPKLKPPKPKPTQEPHRHPIYPQRKPRFTLYPDPPRRTHPA